MENIEKANFIYGSTPFDPLVYLFEWHFIYDCQSADFLMLKKIKVMIILLCVKLVLSAFLDAASAIET